MDWCIDMPLNIRHGYPDDLESMAAMERRCFPFPCAYSKNQLRYLLTKAHNTVLVETHGGILRGFIIVLYRDESRVAGIETLNVDPVYWGRGIGRDLLMAAEQEVRRKGRAFLTLEVSPGNKSAIHLYEKCGFLPKEYLHRYYHFPHQGTRDAIRMSKSLT